MLIALSIARASGEIPLFHLFLFAGAGTGAFCCQLEHLLPVSTLASARHRTIVRRGQSDVDFLLKNKDAHDVVIYLGFLQFRFVYKKLAFS